MTSAATGHSLSDLLAFCYIDDLLSHSNPPRSLPFLVQRLLVVCGGSSGGKAAEHAAESLVSLLRFPSQPPRHRQHLDRVTAAALLAAVSRLWKEGSQAIDANLAEGANRLVAALASSLSPGPGNFEEQLLTLLKGATEDLSGSRRTETDSPCGESATMSQLVQLIQDSPPSISHSDESLRPHLARLVAQDVNSLAPRQVAVAICMMLQSGAAAPLASFERPGTAALSESPSGWNGKVFARVINELFASKVPNFWQEVMMRLDSTAFAVRDRQALILLTSILSSGFGKQGWPMQLLYREWRTNRVGQLTWLQQIVLNADVFCVSEHPHKPVNTHCLKLQPEENNKEIANWRSLELTDCLLRLNDSLAGSQGAQALKIFHTPMSLCPDLLVLALIQLPAPISTTRLHLLSAVVPMLLNSSHSNVVGVLNVAWNAEHFPKQNIHQLILNALSSLYMKNQDDQTKLTKILDIAHELKPNGLTELFNVPQLNFTIDLACLASKRDFLKLEKWLEDKEAEHGEALTMAVLSHLRRRLPSSGAPFQSTSMSQETFTILHAFLTKRAATSAAVRIELNSLITQLHKMKADASRSGVSQRPGTIATASTAPFLPAFAGRAQPPPSTSGHSFFGSSMGGSQELLKGLGQTSAPLPSFSKPLSMSPSTSMMRSSMMPSSTSVSSGWSGVAAPAPSAMRSTPGATTPSAMEQLLRPVHPGTHAASDLAAAGRSVAAASASASAAAANDDLAQTTFSEEIQTEANSYFEKIYSQSNTMPVNELLQKLKAFKNSSLSKDREVLRCVVKNLFEEYKFFKEYPERELRITAEVYGGIIREGIISNLHFATAVRKMIESLQAEVGSMLWIFGIVSLSNCRTKLYNYPKVCMMVKQHENFSKMPESLKAYVNAGVGGSLPPNAGRETPTSCQPGQLAAPPPIHSNQSILQPNRAIPSNINNRTGNTALSYTNVDTLVAATEKEGADVAEPVEAVVDKVSFLFNNLSTSNIHQKKEEIRSIIRSEGESFLRWLAQYIVMKRVSIEQNFQPLYNQFVIAVDNPILDHFIKNETFRNIKILLRTDKRQAASNYNERQLLKNLGMWLGSITIGRNRPIILSELDLKSLLMEAYYKGQQELLYVVPFLAKILIACSKSSPPHIFTPTCAWIHSLLKLLAELHHEPDLKINLKFEIEVLCKELSVDLNSLAVEGVLKDTERLLKVPQQLSDLKQLKQPDTVGGSSPIPPQMRTDGTPPVPGSSDMRSTPVSGEMEVGGAQPGAAAAAVAVAAAASAAETTAPSSAAFHYNDINIFSPESIVPFIKLTASLPLFQLHPQMKHIVRAAVTHAIKELIGPVSERALKVALTVTESVCKKDFALEGDETRLRKAAHHMMRAMTAGMAAITCRDPLSSSLVGYLQQAFTNSLRGTPQSQELSKMIEEAAQQITQDNVEVTTNFIVKTACEKAAVELDKRFESEMEARRAARLTGKPFTNPEALAVQATMPGKLRIRQAPLAPQQLALYDEFATKICGFKSAAEESFDVGVGMKTLEKAADQDVEKLGIQLQFVVRDIDTALAFAKHAPGAPVPTEMGDEQDAWQAVKDIRAACQHLAQSPRDSLLMNKLIVLSVEQLLYAFKNAYVTGGGHADVEWSKKLREVFIGVCRLVLPVIGHAELARRITSIIVSSRVDARFNVYAIEILVRQQLLQSPVYDAHMAHIVDSGSLEAAVFASKLMTLIGPIDQRTTSFRDMFPKTSEALLRATNMLTSNRGDNGPDAVIAGSSSLPSTGQAVPEGRPDAEESPEMQGKVELILREWIALCYTPLAQKDPQQALATMIHMMHEQGVLATDEMITRFFRLCTEMCVDVSYRLLKSEAANSSNTLIRQRCYYTLDAFVKLTCLMVKHSDGSQHQTKINLLKKVLNIVTSVLHNDHEQKLRRGEFQAMPYHRIMIIMFNELTAPDTSLEPIAWSILESFGQAFFILQPRRCPAFAYAWLDIIGHRNVIARLLGESVEPVRTGAMYTQLLICHLKFLAPFLRNIELPRAIATLYRGTLRVLLVILHDFPELLCEYHYVICDAIPPNCVQLRNLILSAYPRNMRLPDPFALSFKQVDAIPEMAHEPKICLNLNSIMSTELRTQLDHYLTTRSGVDFLTNLSTQLQVSAVPGSKYNTAVMNAVVIFVGMRAIENLQCRGQRISMTSIAHTSYMDVFQNLAVQLCTEGRYLLFNAIANQLRFPNVHTHYFSCVFLFLFLHADSPAIKEQITRILFERLVALRPHPWGLLITFIELINNSQYAFWQNDFTRCAPEIERLFQNVANTCVTKTLATPRPLETASRSS